MARVDLGLTEAEFWRLTPAKFYRMCDVHSGSTMREDYRAAIVTYTVRRIIGDKRAQLFDEFPEHRKKLKGQKGTPTAAEIRKNMKAFIEAKEQKKKHGG